MKLLARFAFILALVISADLHYFVSFTGIINYSATRLVVSSPQNISFNFQSLTLKIGDHYAKLDTGSPGSEIDVKTLEHIGYQERGWGLYSYSYWNGSVFRGLQRIVETHFVGFENDAEVRFLGAVFDYDTDFPGKSDGQFMDNPVRNHMLLGFDSVRNSLLHFEWDSGIMSGDKSIDLLKYTPIGITKRLPSIEITMGSRIISAILDTGSSISFISRNMISKFRDAEMVNVSSNKFPDIQGFEDEFVIIPGQLFKKDINFVFLVTEDSDSILTIGLDILTRQDVAFDFINMKLYYGNPRPRLTYFNLSYPILIYFLRHSDNGYHDIDFTYNEKYRFVVTDIKSVELLNNDYFRIYFHDGRDSKTLSPDHPLSIIIKNYQILPPVPIDLIKRVSALVSSG